MTDATGTIALLAGPDGALRQSSAPQSAGSLEKLARVARFRRNPRTPEYMRAIAAASFPEADVIQLDDATLARRIAAARHVVLLWPDAIGYGWAPIERAVFRGKPPGAPVTVVTGRRRRLDLTTRTLLAFRLRRLAERFWLGEAAFAAVLLLSSPFLVVWDLARGRR